MLFSIAFIYLTNINKTIVKSVNTIIHGIKSELSECNKRFERSNAEKLIRLLLKTER